MDTLIVGFSRLDFKGILAPHDDPLVITTRVHGYEVQRILLDGGDLSRRDVLALLQEPRS